MKLTTWLVLLTVLIGYVILGGLVFKALEQTSEVQSRVNVTQYLVDFLDENQCVDKKELRELLVLAITLHSQGVKVTDNSTVGTTWSLHNAIFFSFTVVTTIGYGNISPSTRGGQAFCAIYAIIGIPLCLVVLAEIGDRIRKLALKILQRFKCCKGKLKIESFVNAIIIIPFGIVLLLLVPAVIFWQLEDWTYWEGLYYGIITLTTIGFGDLVAGQNTDDRQEWYRICLIGWILIGLAWMASLLSAMQEMVAKISIPSPHRKKIKDGLPEGNQITSAAKVNAYLSSQMNTVDYMSSQMNTVEYSTQENHQSTDHGGLSTHESDSFHNSLENARTNSAQL